MSRRIYDFCRVLRSAVSSKFARRIESVNRTSFIIASLHIGKARLDFAMNSPDRAIFAKRFVIHANP